MRACNYNLLCLLRSDSCLCLQNLGLDWDERVLPSIGNEIIKAVVAQYNAEQLLTQRDKVSKAVRIMFASVCVPTCAMGKARNCLW